MALTAELGKAALARPPLTRQTAQKGHLKFLYLQCSSLALILPNLWSKSMTLRWDAPELQVDKDSSRKARYRLLQSWYREEILHARPGVYTPRGRPDRPCGSLLHPDEVAARPGLNFLHPKVATYATSRAAEVRTHNGTLEEGRLRHNMLSSMPLCFNLFGMIRETPEARLPFVQQLFDPTAIHVEMVECEWTPRHPDSTINDRTAFDAAIVVRREGGTSHLIGVETKYTEPFSRKPYGADDRKDAGRYRIVHAGCGWFTPESHDRLTASSTNQLWRNCLLAAAAERSGEFASATVVVVALADDRGAADAISGITEAMTDPSRCRMVSFEEIVDVSRTIPSLAEWADEFDRRYLDLAPLD